MFQTKEQNKPPDDELAEKETSNLPDKEVKTMAMKMLNNLRRKIDELSENFDELIANIKKNQPEPGSIITEGKNTLEGTSNRAEGAQDQAGNRKSRWWRSPSPHGKKKKGF